MVIVMACPVLVDAVLPETLIVPRAVTDAADILPTKGIVTP